MPKLKSLGSKQRKKPTPILHENGKKRVLKACYECKQRHTRCDLGRPCSRCRKYGLMCIDFSQSILSTDKSNVHIPQLKAPTHDYEDSYLQLFNEESFEKESSSVSPQALDFKLRDCIAINKFNNIFKCKMGRIVSSDIPTIKFWSKSIQVSQ